MDTAAAAGESIAIAPLSFAQERLWFLEQLAPHEAIYNAHVAIRISGQLRRSALACALGELGRRHETLRTRFAIIDGEPVQAIAETFATSLVEVDMQRLRAADASRARDDAVARLARQPFELTRVTPLRLVLFALAADEHILLVSVHHLIADGWSLAVFTRELVAEYERATAGGAAPRLSTPPIQYADYARAQREAVRDGRLDSSREYWRRVGRRLRPFEVPTTGVHRRDGARRGGVQRSEIGTEIARWVKRAARDARASPFVALLAAWNVVLWRWTRRADIVVRTDVACRDRRELESLIGLLVNQVLLCTTVTDALTLGDVVVRTRDGFLEAWTHRELPYDQAATEIGSAGGDRRAAHSPIHVVFLTPPLAPVRGGGLEFEVLRTEIWRARFDLTLFLRETAAGLAAWIVYDASLFEQSTIRRLLGWFEYVLRRMGEEPACPLVSVQAGLDDLHRREMTNAMDQRTRVQLEKLKQTRPRPLDPSAEVVVRDTLAPGQPFPLVLRPAVAGLDLGSWIRSHQTAVLNDVSRHGAILFRGFAVETADRFEHVARAVCPDLFDENGEHNRENVSGTIYTPTFYPADRKVLWHNENSFNLRWPRFILFCCQVAPDAGGETPIVDSRRVFESISPRTRQRFLDRGVMYVRNYGRGLGLDWQTVFQTGDRSVVERYCRENEMEPYWKDGDRLMTRCRRPAAIRHPETGEPVWFNQAPHWHVFHLDDATRTTLRSSLAEDDLPRQCYYGDGSIIEDAVMAEVRDVYTRLEVAFPWRVGDVLLLDNVLAAHARNPFQGPRKLFVALGRMTSYHEVMPVVAD